MPVMKATIAVGFTASLALLADVTDVVTNVGMMIDEDWANG